MKDREHMICIWATYYVRIGSPGKITELALLFSRQLQLVPRLCSQWVHTVPEQVWPLSQRDLAVH